LPKDTCPFKTAVFVQNARDDEIPVSIPEVVLGNFHVDSANTARCRSHTQLGSIPAGGKPLLDRFARTPWRQVGIDLTLEPLHLLFGRIKKRSNEAAYSQQANAQNDEPASIPLPQVKIHPRATSLRAIDYCFWANSAAR